MELVPSRHKCRCLVATRRAPQPCHQFSQGVRVLHLPGKQGRGPEADAGHRQLRPDSGADLLVRKALGSRAQARPFRCEENDAEGLGRPWQQGPAPSRRLEDQVDWMKLSQPSLPRALPQADSFAPWSRGCPASHSLPRLAMNSLPLADAHVLSPVRSGMHACAQEHTHSPCT